MSPGEGYVDVLKRCLSKREVGEGGGAGPEKIEQRGNGDMRFPYGYEERSVLPPDRCYPGKTPYVLVLHVPRMR